MEVKPMDNNELTALANDLLVCYWDNTSAEDMVKVAAKYGTRPGTKIFIKATDRVEMMLSGTTEGWDLLSPANKTKMFTKSIQIICEETGAELGKDISMVDGGLMIKDEILQPFLDSLAPEELAIFEAKGYLKRQNQDPFKMLEDSLGVPFFTSLEAVVKLRIQTLNDVRSAGYLAGLTGGLQNKHLWLTDGWLVGFVQKVCGGRFDRIAKIDPPDDDDETGTLIFDDLLTALGVDTRHDHPEYGRTITRDELLALDKVFRGTNRSCAELAEMMRRFGEEHRRK
jgi:hypothetical protein